MNEFQVTRVLLDKKETLGVRLVLYSSEPQKPLRNFFHIYKIAVTADWIINYPTYRWLHNNDKFLHILKFPVQWLPDRLEQIVEFANEHPISIHLPIASTLPPSFYDRLTEDQKDGIQYVVNRQGRAIIADTMGFGKSIQGIGVSLMYV
jgi:hypothetical protein